MNRKWLTGLALAGVAGTGSAAYAAVSTGAGAASAAAQAPVTQATTPTTDATTTTSTLVETTTSAPRPERLISYRVGDAGTVMVAATETSLSARGLVPAAGWTVLTMSTDGAHLEIQLTDNQRIVGFVADLVGSDVVVSLTNTRAPGADDATAATDVSIVDESSDDVPTGDDSTADQGAVARPLPAVAPARPAKNTPRPVAAPTTVRPSPASTTATSAAGAHDDGSEQGDDHETHASDSGEHGDD